MIQEKHLSKRRSKLSAAKRTLLEKRLRGELADDSTSQSIIPDPEQRYLPFPLNDIQQAYWIGRGGMFELGNVATHTYIEFECVDLDIERLKRAWQQLIIRHDMLRAVILPDGLQQILQQVPPYEIEIIDLRCREQKVIESELDAVRQRMSHQVLPTHQWPLFEIRASFLDDHRIRLHLSFDALICDALSRALLFQEWSELYQNPHAQLAPLEISFRDYILGEMKHRDLELYRHSHEYWSSRFNSLPPAPELPMVKSPGSVKQPRFTRRKARLAAESWMRLKIRAISAGLTPSGVLLAVYAVVLRLWSKNPQFTINLTLFNRLPLHPHVNKIVGDFTSLILLEVDNSLESRFEAQAQGLQQQLFDDLDHRYVSGVQVMREIVRTRGGLGRAVMPVVFTSILPHDTEADDKKSINWMGDVVYDVSQTPQVWLDLLVEEEAGALMLRWNAVEELFPEGLLDDMFAAYCRLLQRLVNEEESWQESWYEIAENLMPSVQLRQRAAINSTVVPVSEELLHTLFAKQVPQRLEKPAVIAPNQTLTYEDLYRRSNQLGRRLRQLGARQGSLVGVVMEKGWEQVVAVLGVLASGAAYLPIDPDLPQERLRYLLDHGEVKLVLSQPCLNQSLGWLDDIKRLCVGDEDVLSCDESPLETVGRSQDLAYVIYTSGSTGIPKGVMIDHRGAVNTVLDINQRFGVGPKDRVIALSSLSFDLSVYDIFGTLAAGGTIIMPEREATRDPARWAELIRDKRVTIWNSVPTLMALLVEYLNDKMDWINTSLRLVLISGDWVPVSIASVDLAWISIPYGKPMANQKFYVLDEGLAHRPVWVPGKLYIGGIGLAMGYWRDEEKTRASFVTHPKTGERLYLTGDMGRYLPDGNIEFLGREDFQVKIQGFRVELGEIEAALMEHQAVSGAVVNSVGQGHKEKRLVAYVVSQDKPAPDAFELRHFLAKKLPYYMLPIQFIYLKHFPLTSNGKVDRKALPLPTEPDTEVSSIAFRETASILERITKLVMSVLKITHLDVNTNLLNFGANSIDMIRIVNLLEKELNFRPKMDEFFRRPTVLALSNLFEKQKIKIQRSPEELPNILLPTSEAGLGSFELLIDPEAREAFKNTQPGIRRGDSDKPFIRFVASQFNSDLENKYSKRRSYRQFAPATISFAKFGEFMSCLRQIKLSGKPKYLYGSAGGMYPVQTYLYTKPGGVELLPAGTYYYHPVENSLLRLSSNDEFDREVYDSLANRLIFDEAAFAIFLIAQLKAIVPMYGDRSLHFVTIEAGLMAQLLEMSAPSCGIGLCQIGNLEFQRIEGLFDLDNSHVFIHSFIGGLIKPQK
jgi:SagB-type dehydrogenase family enzyme